MKRILQATLLFSALALAHGGRTDASGCHNNRKTGDYHCHGAKSEPYQTAPQTNYNYNTYQSQPSSPVGTSGFTCGTKTYCREMSSCEEAMFYLNTCGLSRLDGDSDGIPCETICN